MSTINRIEVANFLNLNGEGESEAWDPRYRAVTFNFHGQSTALNMTNGVGKTSNVEAWLALLTRDSQLIARTRQKMAPERDGYYSHIRIEFVVPERGTAAQDDFFVQQGSAVAGKETWVFGMYGYRSAGSINFYYYRGSLEKVPVADSAAGTVTLLPNQEFREALKVADRNRHNPVREDWIAELSLHVSPITMRRQAEYQKRGGGDKSAELFALRSRKGENYDVTFFYEVIAPELLSGLMDREGEEGEHEFEDTVLNAVMDVIRTRHNTVRKKNELDKVEQVLAVLDETAQKAVETEKAQKRYEQQRIRMAQDIALLQNLVQEQPLPGIPRSPTGKDRIDRLKASIIIEPGDRYYRILDAGIAVLIGESVGALNQRARRAQSEGRKILQPIVITCDSLSGDGERTGPKASSYTPAVARDLVQSSSKWANGLTRQMALELLDELDSWLLNHAAHRNPYRTQRNELEYDIEHLERDLTTEQGRRLEIARELDGLRDQKIRMEADEAAYRDVQSSGYFTESEWSDPGRMAGQVVTEYHDVDEARSKFLAEKGYFERQKPQWDAFTQRFPDSINPEFVHLQHEEAKEIAIHGLEKVRRQKVQTEEEGRTLNDKINKAETEAIQYRSVVDRFAVLESGLATYAKEFGRESPTGLDIRVLQEKAHAEADIKTVRTRISVLQVMVNDLARFRSETGTSSPEKWLAACEEERGRLQARKPIVEQERSDLERQLQELEKEQVAASPSARQALGYLETLDIAHIPLHQVIEGMALSEGRKREVLSCFSALLFAPVASTEEAALAAANCLAEYDAQVPVFIADALKSFARDGDLKANKDREFYHGLIAGVTTRAVACLLDPSLVKREKERIGSLIAAIVGEESEIQRRLKETAEYAPWVVLARKAQLAVDAESEFENQSKQLQVLEERLPDLRRRASHESLQAIRAAQEFDRLGGEAKQQAVVRNLQEQEQLLEDLRRRDKQNRANREVLDQEEREARERLDLAYPSQLRTMLEQVRQFVDHGGVAFLEAAPRREQELEAALGRANNRKEYRQHLIRAASYLTALRREKAGEDVNGLIARKEGEFKKVNVDIERLSLDQKSLIARRKPLDDAMKAIDQVAQLVQQHFQPASQVAYDLSGTDVDRGLLESNDIFQQAEVLRVAVERGYDLSEVIRDAEVLQDLLGQLEIERDLQELRSLKNQSDGHLKTFLGSVCDASKHEGLSDVEKERMQTVRDLAGTQLVIAMARDIREIYERERSLYEQAAKAESESRSLVTKRIGYFVESAQDNLDLFKRVARAKHGGEQAHFQVSADMISREESEALIENIIATLDEEEVARKKRQTRGMENTESDDQYRGRLRDLIRQNTYRRIFRSPSVKYVSPHIRNDERPRPLTQSLSSGQRTAMTLQWIIRLAEFAISRELQGSISRVSARRRARERAQSILFIDGLFSDLSDEHLIREAMSGIRNTRGRFQLIGLIHNTKYTNDFDVFPVLLLGKVITGRDGSGGWVSIDEQNESTSVADTVQVAEIRKETRPVVVDG